MGFSPGQAGGGPSAERNEALGAGQVRWRDAWDVKSGSAEGISIELWAGEGSGHAPGYGDAFVDALVSWLMAQE